MWTHRHSRVSGKLPPRSCLLIQANCRVYKAAKITKRAKELQIHFGFSIADVQSSTNHMAPLNLTDLQRIFESIDRNSDGFVSIEELQLLLNQIGGGDLISEDLEELIGKSKIDLNEFLRLYESIAEKNDGEEEIESDVLNAFKVFDENGDGFISSDEIGNVLVRLGLWDYERCGGSGGDCSQRMIEAFDTNLDGKLDFQEFKKMITHSSISSS